MKANPAIVAFLQANQQNLINIDLIRELWMIPDRLIGIQQEKVADFLGVAQYTITTESPIYRGKLFVCNETFHAITSFQRIDDRNSDSATYRVTADDTKIKYDPKETHALCTPQDEFDLSPGVIANHPTGDTLNTTLGLFIANSIFLVYPFGDKIPYINEEITSSKLEKQISIRLLDGTISVQDVKDKYINCLSLFGQATEIVVPGISEKTINIPPEIGQLRERLVKENQAALEAGDPAVMSDIEGQLIKAYRKHLEGDSSLHFLLKPKYFKVALKKLFLTQGMTEVFGQPGKFVFIDNPMGNGWKIKDVPAINNEVRSGSYARAIETADGGVVAKMILRVLQGTLINIPNCQTTRGQQLIGSPDLLGEYIWNYHIESDGSESVITPENYKSFSGQKMTIRTPGYCQAPQGFCSRCFGKTFEELGQEAFAPIANAFGARITTAALKRMHGTSHSTVLVEDINKYLVV